MGIGDIITLAKKQGMATIAVTDQDCLGGTERARVMGDRFGVQVIPGVELSSTDAATGKEVHILCYLPESPDRLEGLCHDNIQARKRASQYMLLKLLQRFPISAELVQECAKGATCVYPQHMLRALLESGMTDRIYGAVYEALFSPESDENILVQPKFPSPAEVIDAVRQAGGIAVLAHPGENGVSELLEGLLPLGLDGIEVYHRANTREAQKQLLALAKAENILVTGGSDFRGMYGNGCVTIGCEQVNDAQVSSLLSYKTRMRRTRRQVAAV
jgi:predicted metal-dependent phosphoesterase TrpH